MLCVYIYIPEYISQQMYTHTIIGTYIHAWTTSRTWHVSSVADVAKRLRPGLSCFFFTVDEYVGIHIASGLQYYRTHGRHWALSIDKGTSVSDAERTHAHPRSSAQCSPAYFYVHTCLKTIVSCCEALSWMKALGFLENAVATARVLEDRLLEARAAESPSESGRRREREAPRVRVCTLLRSEPLTWRVSPKPSEEETGNAARVRDFPPRWNLLPFVTFLDRHLVLQISLTCKGA